MCVVLGFVSCARLGLVWFRCCGSSGLGFVALGVVVSRVALVCVCVLTEPHVSWAGIHVLLNFSRMQIITLVVVLTLK